VSSSSNHIIDTVVLLYFLLVKETDLLCTLLGRFLQVPLAVYDPEDRTLPSSALRRSDLLSEVRQSIRHDEHATTSIGPSNPPAAAVGYVDTLYDQGTLVPVPMTPDERRRGAGRCLIWSHRWDLVSLFSRVRPSPDHGREFAVGYGPPSAGEGLLRAVRYGPSSWWRND